ncbi:MAG: tetratricopeptide repeat protein [Deltaproteobacteria bacterium]|nr:MAG: tetratricopeptide repeat protein [Deltaproteobacteria bacterium]
MILKKILLRSLVIAATTIALAGGSSFADDAVNPELYGSWDLLEIESQGMTAQLTLIIDEGRVAAGSKCSFREFSVSVQTHSAAQITGSEIRVLEPSRAMKEYSPGFLECTASLQEGNMQYELRDGQLVLYMVQEEETYVLSRSGGPFKAAEHYKKSRAPQLALNHTNRGTTFLRKGQYDAAIGEYNKALEMNPSSALAYYNRSVAYTSTGQYDKAVKDCNSALQLNPEHANSYYSRGVSYWHLGSKDEAIKDLQAAAKMEHKGAQDFLTSMKIRW